mmetsp:Transcript_53472/g.106439  ORF Transcript_53472/g.106439 Transcript_53472/m.106439 type:complete len:219 (-) Transcript_53472:52-708(-)|eukprot:CAMPEP_0172676452 /NCGR_PEP_ID=MMETSP1074-20121228/13991_1 /TAXON_ID=2916 /ORGANISM="Ceratium fusus, Strain PA161109" /LENGTH=218 /DNA_ID=CAMNT_0013494123 /DNA_START=31 /DNA_END=687 /DNA_ORIENTATION=+
MADAEARDFYDVLGAYPEASPAQIRHAYRQVARRWHPDKAHPADKNLAERRFKEVADAYEVLNDRQQRRLYDLYLRLRVVGYLEVVDPENPHGSGIQVQFRNWKEFQRLFSNGMLSSDWRDECQARWEQHDEACGSEEDAPLSAGEWLLAGGVVLALWCFYAWRHQRKLWLEALPPAIWRIHSEYALPVGWLLSPFFFGTVPFREAADWMRAVMEGEV